MKILESYKASIKRKQERKAFKDCFKQKFLISPYYASDYNNENCIDLITIAFNSPKMISYQIKLIKKFTKGDFLYIVCDNSTDENAAIEIKNICENEDITYIRIEDRSIPKGTSHSHSIALNWVYKNLVAKRQHDFAFLDHDIFPIKETKVDEYLKNYPIYGFVRSEIKNFWYLWPGFCFFKWDFVKDKKLNFHRYKILGFIKKPLADTGSANWREIYSKMDEKKSSASKDVITIKAKNGEKFLVSCFSNASWLHMIDGADRYKTNSNKIDAVINYLDSIILK